jgi:uncharacterized protein (AIM24 family)
LFHNVCFLERDDKVRKSGIPITTIYHFDKVVQSFWFLIFNKIIRTMNQTTRTNHEIDYKIYGEELQFVEIELDPRRQLLQESGAMMMMEDGIEMQTIFGDGSAQQSTGFLGKLMSAGKRVLTGESLFMTAFTNIGTGKKESKLLPAPYTGKIIPMDLQQLGGTIIAQKGRFLCAAKGVSVGIFFQRKLGSRNFWWRRIYYGKDRR